MAAGGRRWGRAAFGRERRPARGERRAPRRKGPAALAVRRPPRSRPRRRWRQEAAAADGRLWAEGAGPAAARARAEAALRGEGRPQPFLYKAARVSANESRLRRRVAEVRPESFSGGEPAGARRAGRAEAEGGRGARPAAVLHRKSRVCSGNERPPGEKGGLKNWERSAPKRKTHPRQRL